MFCYYCGKFIPGMRGVDFINVSADLKERFCNRGCKEQFCYLIQKIGLSLAIKKCLENQNKTKNYEIILWSKK